MTALPLAEAVRHILAGDPGAERFRATLAAVVRHFGADMGMIHRLNPADRHLELVATTDGVPEPVLAAARRIPLGKGIAGETALTGRPVSMCNLQTDTSGVARPGAKATGAQGTLCVPVFRRDEVVGTLGIGVRGERTFTDAETEELLAAGRVLAGSLEPDGA
ncbi:MAG TPA: GAF domain-containing protein [Methylomirabilota bacterium]|jgi:GAF domain-containing protein